MSFTEEVLMMKFIYKFPIHSESNLKNVKTTTKENHDAIVMMMKAASLVLAESVEKKWAEQCWFWQEQSKGDGP